MADGVRINTALDMAWQETKTVAGVPYLGKGRVELPEALRSLLEGTADNLLSKMYQRSAVAVNAEASITYDLAGALTDPYGASITFARVKVLMIRNTGAKALTLGGNVAAIPLFAATNDLINIPPGCFFLWMVGANDSAIAVTASSADLLLVNNPTAGAAGEFDILIAGN